MAEPIKISDDAVEARNLRTVRLTEISEQSLRAMRVMLIAAWGKFPRQDADPKFWQKIQNTFRHRAQYDNDIYIERYLLAHPRLEAALALTDIKLTRKDEMSEGTKVKFVLSEAVRTGFYSMQDIDGRHHENIQTSIPLRVELRAADGKPWINPVTGEHIAFDFSTSSMKALAAMSNKDIRKKILKEPYKKAVPAPKPAAEQKFNKPSQIQIVLSPASTPVLAAAAGVREPLILTPPEMPLSSAFKTPRAAHRPKRMAVRTASAAQIRLIA